MTKKISFPAKIMKNNAITLTEATRELTKLRPGDSVKVTLEWEEKS